MATVQENRQAILNVFRDPAMEENHIRDEYFLTGNINTSDANPPTLKTCPACALGVAALSLGFDKFTWVEAGSMPEDASRPAPFSYWSYSDEDVMNFLCEEARMCGSVLQDVVSWNDDNQSSLVEIADDLEERWAEDND